jgi:phosphomevalonate kinase
MTAVARIWRAPGKVVVLGEYAVLDGAPALVAAVDRGVACHVTPGPSLRIETPGHDDRFVAPALAAAGAPPGTYRFTPWNPFEAPYKVGLGSSAAATVVAVAAGLGPSAAPERIFRLARDVHRRVQGSGSGIDVAASAHGGMVRYRPDVPEPLGAPDRPPVLVWSGQAAATGPRVARYRAWKDRRWFVEESAALVEAFPGDPIPSLRRARALLSRMAREAGVDWATPALDRIAELAEAHGGAAKPSGAGGGDVAIALLPDPEAQAAFLAACTAEGLPPVPVRPAAGVAPL